MYIVDKYWISQVVLLNFYLIQRANNARISNLQNTAHRHPLTPTTTSSSIICIFECTANIKKIIIFIIIICCLESSWKEFWLFLPFAVSDLSLILYFYFIKIIDEIASYSSCAIKRYYFKRFQQHRYIDDGRLSTAKIRTQKKTFFHSLKTNINVKTFLLYVSLVFEKFIWQPFKMHVKVMLAADENRIKQLFFVVICCYMTGETETSLMGRLSNFRQSFQRNAMSRLWFIRKISI